MLKIIRQAKRIATNLFTYVPQRGARYDTKIRWKEPVKYKHYQPIRTGDTATLTITNPDEILAIFRNSKELETADEKVKKLFTLGYQKHTNVFKHYRTELIEKVKEHPLDNNSRSVKIAKLTARIRFYHNLISTRPSKAGTLRKKVDVLVSKRRAHLQKLRSEDYKKFEWLIEVLELQFKPNFHKDCRKVTRKAALILLAKLKAEKLKEEKLAALKKAFDDQKIPFLEQKLAKLKEIKTMEEKFSLLPSVTEEEIQKCVEQLEKVKIQLEANAKVGYLRKIHPYFLEPYYEDLLQEKEKRGYLIREEMEFKKRNKPSQDPSS